MIGYLHVSSASHIHSQLFVYCRRVPSLLWLLLRLVFLLVASLWFWWCDYNRRHAGIMNHNFTVDMTRARHWRETESGWGRGRELGCRALWKIIMTKGKTFHSCDILVEHPLAWLFIKETYVECCCNNNSNTINNKSNNNNRNKLQSCTNITTRKCSRAASRMSNWRRIKMSA